MDISEYSNIELKDAIINKFGNNKNSYRTNSTQFFDLCSDNSKDPLVVEYFKRLDNKSNEKPMTDEERIDNMLNCAY